MKGRDKRGREDKKKKKPKKQPVELADPGLSWRPHTVSSQVPEQRPGEQG